jgi:hypothetical protein
LTNAACKHYYKTLFHNQPGFGTASSIKKVSTSVPPGLMQAILLQRGWLRGGEAEADDW